MKIKCEIQTWVYDKDGGLLSGEPENLKMRFVVAFYISKSAQYQMNKKIKELLAAKI